jgi:hypothetical protein
VTYKPTTVGPTDPSDHTVSASYGGDAKHRTSGPAQTLVSVRKRTTSTTVSCAPDPIVAGTTTRCVATVRDTDIGTPSNPTGEVSWSTDHVDGGFHQDGSVPFSSGPPPKCTLSPVASSSDSSTCSVTYGGTAAGTHVITATYLGDPKHRTSSGQDTVGVVHTNNLRISLDPPSAVNDADTEHCFTATVTDEYGNPAEGIDVVFTVVGPNGRERSTSSGPVPVTVTRTSGADGTARYCYNGELVGEDTITAYLDYKPKDGARSPATEDSDTATKTWVPFSGVPCRVGGEGGKIIVEMESATFGNLSEYVQHGDANPFNAHLTDEVIVCTPDYRRATVFGTATIDGQGTHAFRMDLQDLDRSPAKGVDTLRMRIDTDYDSGEQTLAGGNVKIDPP